MPNRAARAITGSSTDTGLGLTGPGAAVEGSFSGAE